MGRVDVPCKAGLRCEKVSPEEYAIYWPDTEEPREAGTWVCMLFVHFDK